MKTKQLKNPLVRQNRQLRIAARRMPANQQGGKRQNSQDHEEFFWTAKVPAKLLST